MLRNVIVIVTLILVALLPFVTKEHDADVSAGVRIVKDLPYVDGSKDPDQQLDLYIPQGKYGARLPLIVWIHGGGWKAGDKDDTPSLELAGRGFASASINYRLAPKATFPAQVHDCKAAIRWLRAHADEYGLNTDMIGVWGASAGGHLTAMLGTTNGDKALEGDLGNLQFSSSIQAACDWCGPSDLIKFEEQVKAPMFRKNEPEQYAEVLLGGLPSAKPELAKQASPVTYVSQDDPPFFILHSTEDPIVPFEQSVELSDKLTAAGVPTEFVKVDGGNHVPFNDKTLNSVYQFFNENIKVKPAPEE